MEISFLFHYVTFSLFTISLTKHIVKDFRLQRKGNDKSSQLDAGCYGRGYAKDLQFLWHDYSCSMAFPCAMSCCVITSRLVRLGIRYFSKRVERCRVINQSFNAISFCRTFEQITTSGILPVTPTSNTSTSLQHFYLCRVYRKFQYVSQFLEAWLMPCTSFKIHDNKNSVQFNRSKDSKMISAPRVCLITTTFSVRMTQWFVGIDFLTKFTGTCSWLFSQDNYHFASQK